ncbi:MAG: hypothetical protein JWP36_915 [Paucimonas sp.]|nr:hypothetical protein [Paucimonas sp.]
MRVPNRAGLRGGVSRPGYPSAPVGRLQLRLPSSSPAHDAGSASRANLQADPTVIPAADASSNTASNTAFTSTATTRTTTGPHVLAPAQQANVPALPTAVNADVIALLEAACQYDPPALRRLLEMGYRIDATDRKGQTALHHAARTRNFSAAKLLCECGANVGIADDLGTTPLMIAVGNADHQLVELLLVRGATVGGQDYMGRSALHYAAAAGSLVSIEALCNMGAEINRADKWKMTPLHLAAEANQLLVVRTLVRKGANPWIADSPLETPFLCAVRVGAVEVAKFLNGPGGEALRVDRNKREAVDVAARSGQTAMLQALHEWGFDIRARGADRKRPVEQAFWNGHFATVDKLVELSGKKLKPDRYLHSAVRAGKIDLVRTLLQWGASVDGLDANRKTPLCHAVATCRIDTASLLVERGASLEKAGGKALFRVAMARRPREPARDSNKEDVEDLSVPGSPNGKAGMVAWLLEKFDAQGEITSALNAALTPAVEFGHANLVRQLLKAGAAVDDIGLSEKRPLATAIRLGRTEIAAELLQHGASFDNTDPAHAKDLLDAILDRSVHRVECLLRLGVTADREMLDRLTSWTPKAVSDQLLIAVEPQHLAEAPLRLARMLASPDMGRQFVTRFMSAFAYQNRSDDPALAAFRLAPEGILSVHAGQLHWVRTALLELGERLYPGGEPSAPAMQILAAALLAQMKEPEYDDYYEPYSLTSESVAALSAHGRAQYAGMRAAAMTVLERTCIAHVKQLVKTCVVHTNLLARASTTIAPAATAAAGLLPAVSTFVQSCWNQAFSKAKPHLRLRGRLQDQATYLEKEMPVYFARELAATPLPDGFYEHARMGPQSGQAYRKVLDMQLGFIKQYHAVAPASAAPDITLLLETV